MKAQVKNSIENSVENSVKNSMKKSELKKSINDLNIDNFVERSISKKQSLWSEDSKRDIFLKRNPNKQYSEKRARYYLRTIQIDLSLNVVKKSENANNRKLTLKEYCTILKDFYTVCLVDFTKYSNKSETGKNIAEINKAYLIMKKELNL